MLNLEWIASAVGSRTVRRRERIQSLWGGYGELFRVELDDRTAVVKWAKPPAGVAADASFARKCRSYDVETAFYREVAPRCDDACRVPLLLAARGADREWVLVLEDLDAAGYRVRTDDASDVQLDRALSWLASFHARFVGEGFPALWSTGTYWHLGTRRDELDAIEDRALRDAAPLIEERLASVRFSTLLHGDPKEANFCWDRTASRVAAVDFQYTGHGCAMSDLAYLLYGRSDEPATGIDDARLARYFQYLRAALPANVDGAAIEAEWRALYAVARLDFCRFLAGWRPALWRGDMRGQRFVRENLAAITSRSAASS